MAGLDLEFDFPEGLHFYSFHFQLEILTGIDLFSTVKTCQVQPFSHLEQSFISSIPNAGGLLAALTQKEFLFSFSRRQCERLKLTPSHDLVLRKTYAPLFDYLEHDLSVQTTIDDLAKEMGWSRDRLSRDFHRDFGMTLKKFLMTELGRRAELQLLSHPDKTVKEIADMSGFANQFYFSRFFKRHAGVPPREFQKLHF